MLILMMMMMIMIVPMMSRDLNYKWIFIQYKIFHVNIIKTTCIFNNTMIITIINFIVTIHFTFLIIIINHHHKHHIISYYTDISALQTIQVNNTDDSKISMLKVELQASKWNRVDSSKYCILKLTTKCMYHHITNLLMMVMSMMVMMIMTMMIMMMMNMVIMIIMMIMLIVTIFIEDNYGHPQSVLHSLQLFGTPIHFTNVANIHAKSWWVWLIYMIDR